jgi:hypothetical protein
MDREKLVRSGRKLGRDLAERIIDRQRQVELPDSEIDSRSRRTSHATRGPWQRKASARLTSFWVEAVAAGYGLRFDEETGTT